MECYHRALIYQPGLIDVQLSLAELYREQGRPQRALATVQRISDSIPDEQLSPKAWLLQGQALADLGEIDAAYGCLANAALCASDADTEVLLELAETQFAHGDVVRAKQCVDRALRHDPQNPQALTWLETLAQPQQLQGARGELVGFEQSTHGN
jgi:tetratricopeptide (TPR) repeat protein